MERGKDQNGHYYKYKEHKEYYIIGNPYSRKVARDNLSTIIQGDGLKDILHKVVKGVKYVGNKILDAYLNTMPNNLKTFLLKYGDDTIRTLTIARVPINEAIRNVINIASKGELEKNMQYLNYDNIYHLQLVINQTFILEKNSIIEVKPFGVYSPHTAVIRVPLNINITISTFITHAIKKTGPQIFRYNPAGHNCQNFVMSLLDGSNLNNPILTNFILQDSTALLKNVPDLSKITDIGALVDRVILGKGV
jgi:hypothetical protein